MCHSLSRPDSRVECGSNAQNLSQTVARVGRSPGGIVKQLVNTIGAIAVMAAILGCAVLVVLAATFTYPWFATDMVNSAQLTPQQITENYQAVIDYCLLPWVDEFTIPHLPFSAAGAQHFIEAKALFQGFIAAGLSGAVVAAVALWHNWRARRAWGGWIAGGAAVIVTIVALGAVFVIDFDRAFVVFHEIAFGNDLWIFDPRVDPIINYLPQSLFLANAFAILALMVIGSLVSIAIGMGLRSRARRAS